MTNTLVAGERTKLRIKSTWFRTGSPKSPQQNASAMAFITWRVSQHMLKQMRSAHFDIEVGQQYFAFTREVLVFMSQVIDRWAFERMSPDERMAFVSSLVRRVAEILEENEDRLMGPPDSAHASHFDQFIDQFNALSIHYADFGLANGMPDFAFVRYLGHRIESLMPQKDQRWVIDQIMAIEIPEALEMLQRGMQGVLSTEPRPQRSSRALHTGD
jgi:hypothetical protein